MSDVLFHRLRVSEVIAETADARSLVFDLAPHQVERFRYTPGQFLTLRIPHHDGPAARCYSLASSPHVDHQLKVTVKRVDDGYGSNWICDNAARGVEFDVLEPAGVFTPRSLDDDLLLFAGGSGITPIMSILKSVLASGTGAVTLFYANRDENSVIFREELNRLTADHPDRLLVLHWLESVQGLPSIPALRSVVRPYIGRESFVCGPRPFMDAVRKVLREMDVPRKSVHLERFASLAGNPFQNAQPAEPLSAEPPSADLSPAADLSQGPVESSSKVEVEMDGEQHTFDWPARTRLLDLLKQKGLSAPSSCSEGMCAACECRVVEGEVRMENNQILEDEDLAEGYVLACQALPVTDTVKITYS